MNSIFPNSAPCPVLQQGRVAILMRTKNRPVLLVRALMSVLSQTYANWHLYLVNDGGEYDELEVLIAPYRPAFAEHLTVKHHPQSQGMEAASNSALQEARDTYDYVVVHDDDDAWRPTFLEQTVAFLETPNNSRYGAVAARCEVVHEEITKDNRVIEKRREPFGYWKERIDLLDMLRTNSIPPICLLIRKYIVDQIGAFNPSLPVLGDWDYNIRILMLVDIGTINVPLAYYHHRVTGDAVYGNSVHAGLDRHLDYQVLYRNALVRALLAKEPGYAGFLNILLVRLQQLEDNLNWMHWDMNNLTPAWGRPIDRALHPVRWAWKKLIPVRRLVAKVRGRV